VSVAGEGDSSGLGGKPGEETRQKAESGPDAGLAAYAGYRFLPGLARWARFLSRWGAKNVPNGSREGAQNG
jgi:hypothetical protein